MNFKKYIKESYLPYKKELIVILLLSLSFIIGFSIESYSIAVLPIALLVTALFFINFKAGLYITAFILPFSLNISYKLLGVTLNTPLEPFLFILTILTIYHIGFKGIDSRLVKHPVSIFITLLWFCFFLSCCFSASPFTSLRIALQTFAFVIPAYWGVLYISQTDKTFPGKLLATSLFSFSLLSCINFFKHANNGFSRAVAWDIPNPFYTDHTIYATMAAFMIPLAFVLMIWYAQKNLLLFLLNLFLLLLCFSALILSYSRGALLSVAIAFALYVIIRWKISWKFILSVAMITVVILFVYKDDISMSLRRNRAESKARKTNIESQLKSVANVTNDVSNLERINRWSSAYRMIQIKPFFGFGYGMYQHSYFAYQKEHDMTVISIRNPQSHYEAGTGGTAHSEYLLMSSENGILAGLLYISILVSGIIYTVKNIEYTYRHDYTYYLILGLGMSLTTYIVHSFFNNFLDTAKINFVFYAILAAIVSLNIVLKEPTSQKIIN